MTRAQKRWLLSASALLVVAILATIFLVRWRQQFLPHVVTLAPSGDAATVVSLSSDGQFIALSVLGPKSTDAIEIRELLSNRRVAFFSNVEGSIFSPDGRFLTLVRPADAHTKKSSVIEFVELGSWKSKYQLPFPAPARDAGRNSYAGETPSFIYSKSGKYLAAFAQHEYDERLEIWKLPSATPERTLTLKGVGILDGCIWGGSLKDDGTLIDQMFGASPPTQPRKSSATIPVVAIASPIDSSCPGSTPRASSSRLRVGLQFAKSWHAFLFDSWTGKILKDLRDPANRAQMVHDCGISGNEKTIAISYDNYIGLWIGNGSNWKMSKKIELPSVPVAPVSDDGLFLSQHGEFLVQNLDNNRLYWRRIK